MPLIQSILTQKLQNLTVRIQNYNESKEDTLVVFDYDDYILNVPLFIVAFFILLKQSQLHLSNNQGRT